MGTGGRRKIFKNGYCEYDVWSNKMPLGGSSKSWMFTLSNLKLARLKVLERGVWLLL